MVRALSVPLFTFIEILKISGLQKNTILMCGNCKWQKSLLKFVLWEIFSKNWLFNPFIPSLKWILWRSHDTLFIKKEIF